MYVIKKRYFDLPIDIVHDRKKIREQAMNIARDLLEDRFVERVWIEEEFKGKQDTKKRKNQLLEKKRKEANRIRASTCKNASHKKADIFEEARQFAANQAKLKRELSK